MFSDVEDADVDGRCSRDNFLSNFRWDLLHIIILLLISKDYVSRHNTGGMFI